MKRLLTMSVAIMCMASTTVLAQNKKNPTATPARAEKEISRLTNAPQLKKLSGEFKQQYTGNKQRALELAQQKNWVVRQVNKDGRVMSLEGVDASGYPIYYITDNNVRAAASVRTNQLWSGGSTGLNLSGSNSALSGKLGVWDGGLIRATHQELTGRMVKRDNATTLSDHATHVAGTMVASGVNPYAKGMSFGALNLQGWDFSNDIAEMADAASGLLVSNHSYGTTAGWFYNDTRAGTAANPFWEWRGNASVSTTEDVNFGYYNSQAQSWDQIAYNAPYYLMVKSAGNFRSQTGPAVGTPCWFPNAQGTLAVINRPEGISSNNSYDIISTYGNAKNILTVGAVEPIPNGWQRKEDVRISSFSSYGPTDDGRIKPDIVGNGVSVISSVGTGDSNYSSMNGTSMSAPNVSGSLHLLQEHYFNKFGVFMRAATLKGLAIHTADEAGNTGPDYIYGWGLLNMERAANLITNTDATNLLQERTLDQGQNYTFTVTASGKGPLAVTISWTDVEGAVIPLGTSALNNRTPRLVNDLDIRVNKGLTVYMPWVLDPNNPANPAGFGDNIRDNVEQVYIANAVPGETYTITVSHKGTLSRGPQQYSLLVSGIGGSAYCASGAISDSDSKITNLTFGGINNSPAGCATYSNFTDKIATLQVGQTLPLSLTLGTCGVDNDKIAKVFIDWNGNGTFEAGELVATTAVFSTTGTFTTNVTVPQSVAINTHTRMRIVLVETDSPNNVQACGNYAKGETQDYLVQFVGPSKDVGITSLIYPTEGLCANPSQAVSVMLRNFGSEDQSNLPVSVTVTSNGNTVATLSTVYSGTLAPYSEVRIVLPGTFAVEAGKTYTITSQVTLANDQFQSNNQRTDIRSASLAPAAPQATATLCGTSPISLKGTGDGTIFWYDAETGGNLLAAGNNAISSTVPTGNTVYAALNDFSGKVGPTSKAAFTGGGYGQYGPSVLVTAHAPFVLESARLYIGNPGRITFTVETLNGAAVSSTTLEVTNTRPTIGTTDDPNDLGAVYPLNLSFPSAGNYRIAIAYENGATIYRNNAGVTGYPFTIPNVMSITSNTASGPLGFYYYFYDINIKAFGCTSPRVAVPVTQSTATTATITPASATTFCTGGSVLLRANTGQGLSYAWFRDGVAIANATSSTYEATTSGDYTVNVTADSGCPKLSDKVAVVVNPVPPSTISISRDVTLNMCLGENFAQTLRAVTSTTHSSYAYQWFKDGAPISNATSATYVANSSGSYTVRLSASCGSSISSSPVVINNDAAQVTAPGAEICTGSNVNLSAQTTNGKLYWFNSATGGNLLNVGNTYTTPTLTQSTTYFVAASNETVGKLGSVNHSAGGSSSSFTGGRMYFNAITPFVLEKATINVTTGGTMTVIITDKDLSNTIINSVTINVTPGIREYDLGLLIPAAGNNYGLQVSAFGGGATAYRNNAANSAVYPYTLPGVASITGNNQTTPSSFFYFLYDWQVSTLSCQSGPRIAVPVNVAPNTVAGALAASASEVCFGGNGTVSLSGQTGNVVRWESSTDGTTWTTINNTATTLSFADLTVATSFRAVVQSGNCAPATTQSVSVNVKPQTVAGVLRSTAASVCKGNNSGNVTLSNHVGDVVKWQFSFNGTTWMDINTSATSLQYSNLNKTISYRAIVKNSPCSELTTDALTINVSDLPSTTITASGATSFCEGGAVTLSAATGTGYTYLWSNGATTSSIEVKQPGNYNVVIRTAEGCSVTSSATPVTVNSKPVARIDADGNTNFCQGGSVKLTASEGESYLWSNGATTRSITVGSSGSYIVTVSNAAGCSNTSAPTVVNVSALPNATITANGSLEFCEGGSVTLTASEGSNYQWSNGATTRSITVSDNGNYTVSITNSTGCTAVSQETRVTKNLTPGKPSIVHNGTILTSSAETGNQWYRNGIAISGATTKELTVTQSGIYTVRSVNSTACSSPISDEVNVTITSASKALDNVKGLQVFPNPNKGAFTVSFSVTKAEKVVIKVVNSVGQVVFEDLQSRLAGEYERSINLERMPTGVYMLHVQSGNKVQTRKVVVRH